MTRPEDIAHAFFMIAAVNHYMVGFAGVTTEDELSAARQLMISRQNAIDDVETLTVAQKKTMHERYEIALDLLEEHAKIHGLTF